MSEIILSFFAVIGITFLAIYTCDYFFFRKFGHKLSLIADLREKNEAETIEIFELILSIRERQSGKALLGEMIVLVNKESRDVIRIAKHYMDFFHLDGNIYTEDDHFFEEKLPFIASPF